MLRKIFGKPAGPDTPQWTMSVEPARPDVQPQQATLPWGSVVQVVGESHYEESFLAICGPRNPDGYSLDCIAELRPQPENPYDSAAVAVFIQERHVGYLSREDARLYGPAVNETIRQQGAATCYAVILGGWDRGGNDQGNFGVRLRFSDRSWEVAPVALDEIRLAPGGAISVSNEQAYQDSLIDALRGRDISARSFPVLAELVPADRNPHVKKADPGRVIEVRIDGRTVGFLTEAMSKRFIPTVESALAEGKRTTCEASLFTGAKAGEEIIEVRLHTQQPAGPPTVVLPSPPQA